MVMVAQISLSTTRHVNPYLLYVRNANRKSTTVLLLTVARTVLKAPTACSISAFLSLSADEFRRPVRPGIGTVFYYNNYRYNARLMSYATLIRRDPRRRADPGEFYWFLSRKIPLSVCYCCTGIEIRRDGIHHRCP